MARGIGGEVEAAVMAVVWSADRPMTVREVLDEVNRGRNGPPLAYTTILTVMGNLARKGMLTQHTGGRAFRYSRAVGREEYIATTMNAALDAAGDRTAALLHFAAQLDADERRALLEQARRIRRRRRA